MKQIMPAAMPRGQRVSPCPTPGHHAVDRWELLSLVTELRRSLGLADRDIMVLRAHLSVLPQGPLVPGALNMSFMNLTEILDRACGMDERRFRRGEVRLEEAGLLIRRLSANGRRFPERDAAGVIVGAYGIDLNPLIDRHDALRSMKQQIDEDIQRQRQRRNALSARMAAVLRACASVPPALADLRDTLRNALRRKHPCETELAVLEARLTSAEAEIATKSAPVPRTPDRPAADAGQTVRHIEPEQKDLKEEGPALDPAEIPLSWAKTRTLKEFYGTAPQTQQAAYETLTDFASFLRITRGTVEAVLMKCGWAEAIRLIDHIATGLDRIRHPDRYLRAILEDARSLRAKATLPR